MPPTWLAFGFAGLGTLLLSSLAHADSPSNCPPGSWYCAEDEGASMPTPPAAAAPKSSAESANEPKAALPPPANPAAPTTGEQPPAVAPTTSAAPPPAPSAPPPAPPPAPPGAPMARRGPSHADVTHGPLRAPPPPYLGGPTLRPLPPPVPPPPPPARLWRPEWGIQGRFETAVLGSSAPSGAGMNGGGISLRPRPTPYFALDIGLDFLGGTDWNANSRNETAFTLNPTVFLNPRNRLQVYLLAGFGFADAHVQAPDGGAKAEYQYLGMDAGVGLEFRLHRHLAFSGDVVGFIRGRTDRGAQNNPEFVDASTGRTTNASGGGLLRLGLTFYW